MIMSSDKNFAFKINVSLAYFVKSGILEFKLRFTYDFISIGHSSSGYYISILQSHYLFAAFYSIKPAYLQIVLLIIGSHIFGTKRSHYKYSC